MCHVFQGSCCGGKAYCAMIFKALVVGKLNVPCSSRLLLWWESLLCHVLQGSYGGKAPCTVKLNSCYCLGY